MSLGVYACVCDVRRVRMCVCVHVCVHVISRSTKSAAGRGEGLGGLGASLHRLIHAFNGLEHRLRKFAILHGTFSDVDRMYQRFVAASPWNASCCDGKRRFAGDWVCGHLLKMKDFELLARGVAQGAIHDYRRPCWKLPDFGPHTLNQGRHLNLGRVHLHPLIFIFGAAYVVNLYLVLLCVDLLHFAVPATVLSAPTAVGRGDIQRALQTRTPLAPPVQDVSIDSVEAGFAASFVAGHHAPFFLLSHFFSCRRLALCSGAARKRRVKDLMRVVSSHRFGAGEHPTDLDPRNKEQNRMRRESTHHHSPSHITSTTKSGFSRMISNSGRIQLSSESSVGAVQPSAMHPHITAALWESVGKQIVKQSACGICAVPPITCAVAHAQVQTA